MVTSINENEHYRVVISNGEHEITADAPVLKGGSGSAMRPHQLLEAALASCLNITIRMYADKKGIPLSNIRTMVTADRSQIGETVFQYSYAFDGNMTDRQLERLQEIVAECPIQKMLANRISFKVDHSEYENAQE